VQERRFAEEENDQVKSVLFIGTSVKCRCQVRITDISYFSYSRVKQIFILPTTLSHVLLTFNTCIDRVTHSNYI
jgi:hypothetical protein